MMHSAIDPATGLSHQITQWLRAEIQRFPEVRAVYLFGSRARGDYSPQSDVDIAVDAPDMSHARFAQLWSAVDALPIAFALDCVWLQALPESRMRDQLARDARIL